MKEETFGQFIDKLLGKEKREEGDMLTPFDNRRCVEFQTITALAYEDCYKKYGHAMWYHKHKPTIQEIISNTVAMSMHCQELKEAREKNKKSLTQDN